MRNTSADTLSTLLLTNPFLFLNSCGLADSPNVSNQGWYDNVIAVDPKDPNRVWAGGIDLFRSDDAGRTWGVVSYWWPPTLEIPSAGYTHADQHAIVFHPQYNGTTNQTLFVGGDGGIFRTGNARAAKAIGLGVCDPTASRVVWAPRNEGYEVTQFYHGSVAPDGGFFLGGTQDNGTHFGENVPGFILWTRILPGDGGYTAVDPTDPLVLYGENTGLSIQKSVDGGTTFSPAIDGIEDAHFLFIAPFHQDSSDSNVLFSGGFFVWRTQDGAATWTKASDFVAGGSDSVVSALATAPSNPNRALAGLSRGYIHRTDEALFSDGETEWPVVRPRDGFVSSLAFDPFDDEIAYATYSTVGNGKVWRTTNGGATWSRIDGTGSNAIPDIPVHSIVVDPDDPTVLFIGTDLGVFVSFNGGQAWLSANVGLPNVVTEHLAIQVGPGSEKALYAFTHGRGAWKVAL